MDSPVGKIVAIGSASATVVVARTAACPRCAKGLGCGAGLMSGGQAQAVLEVPLPAARELAEGDEVLLVLEPSNLLRATLLVYGLPLAGMILALTAGWLVSRPLADVAAIALAVAGLAAGLIAGRRQLSRRQCLQQFVPTIGGRADAATEFP